MNDDMPPNPETSDPNQPFSEALRQPLRESVRIELLASLPVFFKLKGKSVLVWGASPGLVWKVDLLASAGANIHLVTNKPELFAALEERLPSQLSIDHRDWQTQDFAGKFFALGDTEHEEAAIAFQTAAKAAGLYVNMVDRPKLCDFQFGAIVNRSPLVISLSTDGAAPVFGQALRAKIEALIPYAFQRWAQAAQDWRQDLQKLALPFRVRRQFWERFSALALANPNHLPNASDCEGLLGDIANEHTQSAQAAPTQSNLANLGRVALVGAGPGDPELLTLKALRLLQSADVILYDDLVSPHIVAMGRREAERITVGKRGYKPSCTQDDISSLLVALAKAGKHVVRLKGGDPMIFGRAGEEIHAVLSAGIPLDIVPGVTAASGAAASLKTSLTHRNHARRVQFVTAHAKGGELPKDLDWRALADKNATTVVYMGVATLGLFVSKLLAEGLSPETPVCIVERATTEQEKILSTSLAFLSQKLAEMKPQGPCVVILGSALAEMPPSVGDALVQTGTIS